VSRILTSKVIVPATLALTAIAACATVEETYGPSGRTAYTIECSGTGVNWGDCYAKAGNLCQERGYDVVQQSDEEGATGSLGNFGAFDTSLHFRSMTIECGEFSQEGRGAAEPVNEPPPAP
jgi:hypothetical protein